MTLFEMLSVLAGMVGAVLGMCWGSAHHSALWSGLGAALGLVLGVLAGGPLAALVVTVASRVRARSAADELDPNTKPHDGSS